jgi:hypothetical protein
METRSDVSRAWIAPAAIAAAAAGGALLTGLVAPRGQAFYPRCPLYALTGVYCPGCGATRAVHELVTGHLAAAAHDNLLLLVVLPVVVYLWLGWLARTTGRAGPRPLRLPSWWPVAMLVVAVAYGVVRNLPFTPFTALAPLP